MRHKGKYFKLIVCTILLVLLLGFPLTGFSQTKDKIRIGYAISLSGPYASGAKLTQITNYELWAEDVNAKGGIFVKEYGRRLPVELVTYDDKSDVGTVVKLVEKLILEDKVDLLLPPWGNAMNFAVAPVAGKYGYPLVCPTISSMKIMEMIHTLPYFFVALLQPPDAASGILELLKEFKVKKVAVIYLTDLRAIEITGVFAPLLAPAGMDVSLMKTYPLGVKDLSPLLKTVKAARVDALIAFSYPPDTILITEQAKVLGLNPKAFYLDIGVAHPYYRDRFGAATLEGVLGAGAWNKKTPIPGVKEYIDRYTKRWKGDPDWAGALLAYASCQIMEQAVEIAGSLDRAKIRDIIAKETFPTLAGQIKFVDGFNREFTGFVGQWQKGVFEVVSPKEKRTATPIYPKPPWPK